jgi:hypothetical protein
MDTPPDIAAFWQSFADSEAQLASLEPHERVERCNALLEPHITGLALELLGHPHEAVSTLVVTAHGATERFPLVMDVVAAAPALQHHTVEAFRARIAESDFPIRMDGFELATSDVLVALEQDSGQVALELRYSRDIPQDFVDHARNMTFIMLDHVLGEYDFAVKVGAVDFVGDDFDPDVDWTPLNALPAVLDAHWVDVLGHTGDFPVGECLWDTLELQHEDGDDDAEVAKVNTSANAVAMRADFAYALTLTVPTPDEAAMDAAQDLCAQAGTVLQVQQQGIGVLLHQQADKLQAVYYVGGAAQAQAALAPLLQRNVALNGQMECAYDPAWSRYFELASFLE